MLDKTVGKYKLVDVKINEMKFKKIKKKYATDKKFNLLFFEKNKKVSVT